MDNKEYGDEAFIYAMALIEDLEDSEEEMEAENEEMEAEKEEKSEDK